MDRAENCSLIINEDGSYILQYPCAICMAVYINDNRFPIHMANIDRLPHQTQIRLEAIVRAILRSAQINKSA